MPKGKIVFSPSEVFSSNASSEDKNALIDAIVLSWDRYLHQDVNGYTSLLAADVTRMSQRLGQLQQGRDVVINSIKKEWEAFERPDGLISEEMTINRAEFVVDNNPNAKTATALYWVDIEGGTRWKYDDQGLVFQAFAKINGSWKITHQIDSWSLDYNVSQQKPAKGTTFEFDYAYPVTNLQRAVEFYRPILGDPEGLTKTRAYFNLKGPRFILDGTLLDGNTSTQKNLPCGYGIFYVKDVVTERDRLKAAGVKFLAGTDKSTKICNQDKYVIGLDPEENIFVLMQKNFTSTSGASAPMIEGFNSTDAYILAAKKLSTAWIKMDKATIDSMYGNSSLWFDDTRLKTRGMEKGANIISALTSVYWPLYDSSSAGLIAKMEVSCLKTRQLGKQTIVSYQMKLSGTGSHPFQDTSLITHVFDDPNNVTHTFIVANNKIEGMVLEFDYTGYPEANLSKAENFYTKVMQLGKPYTDEDWFGYWSNNGVFGIYTSDLDDDGIPRKKQSNGYLSFWIRSAQETYDYLKKHGSNFPIIPAINDVKGLDKQPGYIQVVATDSEGNVSVFTEYTGRKK